jgi:hypothetical protein
VNDNPILKSRATLNPYLFAGGLIWSRLRWDLDFRAWVSRTRLRRLRNAYPGEKAVVLCNGPSLLKTDWSLLDGVYTFGLNKVNLLFDELPFRPSCVVAVNALVLEQNAAFYNGTELPLFLDSCALQQGIRFRDNVVMLHSTSLNKFARDCSISVYQGGTVTFVAMQLAFHMGFTDVALIGCDHSFIAQGPANAVVRRHGPDLNHFHPDYFPEGSSWHLPDIDRSESAYRLAHGIFTAFGGRIVNATDGGKLEIFPRMTLDAFLRRT